MNDKFKKFLIIFSICLNIGFIIIAGYALVLHKSPHDRHKSRFYRHAKLFEKLDMQTNQQKEINQLINNYVLTNNKVHSDAIKLKLVLYSLLEKPGLSNENELKDHLKKIQEAECKKEEIKFEHLLDIKRVLTGDQAQKFFQTLKEYKQKHILKYKPKH